MSGYAIVHSKCAACSAIISYNPHRVPSVIVSGRREAICPACHARWNEIHRTSKGLEPLSIHPDAYKPIPENEL